MSSLHRNLRTVTVAALALIVGCGGSGAKPAPAAGTVLVDGKPIEGAQVVFELEDNASSGAKPVSRGVTDAGGRFRLKTLTAEKTLVDGATVGTHRVKVSTRIVEQDDRGNTRVLRQELLDDSYLNGEKLTAEVPSGGIEDLHFELSSKQ